ncbi:MAG: phospho-sugar mutase [Bacteroidales bacterium]|nr:phospho-sugar mutase [Bacteroidales bacterium]MCF8333033.1 phospho-sugar mutase [Bacteroidales bacterium]
MAVEKYIIEKAQTWLEGNFDEETKQHVKTMLDNNEEELVNAFYTDLEFGTGGLRGVMGVGTNRMNKYTVGMTTQGLANYLLRTYPDESLKVAIAFDCRHNNTFFAQTTANVLSANGIEVFVFDDLRPTPELSFAIRHLKCHSGVMITASHNPKEYNGYKVYWNDGGQIVPPHDKNIIAEVQKIQSVDDVKFKGNPDLIKTIGEEVDTPYINHIKDLSLSPSVIQRQQDLKIVYTPLHGTGVKLVPRALQAFGFKNIYHVEEQDAIDGDFPTVHSPNPEESPALDKAIKKARDTNAGLVMATDPDADRVGIAVKNDKGEHVLLNGNQTASILIYYLLTKWQEQGKLTGREYIVKTVVTTDLLKEIADYFEVPTYNTLTGFKWIADLIRKKEEKETFIGGGEESYGYLVGDFVRDKDAVISCAMIAEVAAWAADKGKSLYQLLPEIYQQFSFYYENLMSVKREGKEGAEEIQQWMKNYRRQPPKAVNGSPIVMIKDYSVSEAKNIKENRTEKIDLPQSNVLQFFTEDGSKITMRPSGTEPKIKYYFSVKGTLENKGDFERKKEELDQKINNIIKDLKIAK